MNYGVQAHYISDNALALENLGTVTVDSPIVEILVKQPLPRKAGLPLVDDWECLRVIQFNTCPGRVLVLLPREANFCNSNECFGLQ